MKETTFNPSGANNGLLAGAGVAEIIFDPAMFPTEGFNGVIHDLPHARVLIIENDVRVAVAALELVQLSEELIEACKEIVCQRTGTEKHRVWIHATHAITTPHPPSDDKGSELHYAAIVKAVDEAAQRAADAVRPAVMGVGTGQCDVNANRDLLLNGEWYYGMGSTMPSNKVLTILRFDGLDGTPIGFLMSYGIKPTCIYNVGQSANTRQISSDVPGLACTMVEEAFSAPCLFFMPAAGDQIPKEIAMFYRLDENGDVAYVELSVEEGIEMMTRQGIQMGDAAIEVAKGIACSIADPAVAHTAVCYNWPNKVGDGEVEILVDSIQLGDSVALVGLKPEVNCVTELELWDASPFRHTLLVTFLNGDQKYMPDKEAYQLGTREFTRSGCAVGCAERFVQVAAGLLGDLLAGKAVDEPSVILGRNRKQMSIINRKIEFGGHTWIVLDKKDGKTLVVSEKVLERRAYHSPGGAVTWEDCELRRYLNEEFFRKTFTDAEKRKIAEAVVENKSNTKYGVRGGNDTTDRIFLLSLQEAEDYLFGFTQLLNAVDAATGEITWWHLRSPGEGGDAAARVTATGLIDYHGVADGVLDPTGGVRPAMWLEID